MFDCRADASENAFAEVLPLLRDRFPAEKWEAEKKWRRGEPTWTPDQVEQVILDSFETPIRRPSINARQKRVYSGKKKRHTLKTQVVTEQRGDLLCVGAPHPGPKADIKIYEPEPPPAPVADKPRMGDKAYASKDHPEIVTPLKKPKGRELSAAEKAKNKAISQPRVYVEHAIRRIKGWRIMRDD